MNIAIINTNTGWTDAIAFTSVTEPIELANVIKKYHNKFHHSVRDIKIKDFLDFWKNNCLKSLKCTTIKGIIKIDDVILMCANTDQ